MLTRLTALILTLCIGLPMCWCCIVAPQREEVASCCARKHHATSEQSPTHSQEPNCPCVKHETSRDVAANLVKAPTPALHLLIELTWAAPSPASWLHPFLHSPLPVTITGHRCTHHRSMRGIAPC